MKGRGVPVGYVEGLNEARTLLANFFSIPLVLGRDGGNTSQTASFFARICLSAEDILSFLEKSAEIYGITVASALRWVRPTGWLPPHNLN